MHNVRDDQGKVVSPFMHPKFVSKHLKDQLDPPVRDVTFLDQSRSVGSPCWSGNVFGSSKGLRAGGAKGDVENTPKLYHGPIIQSSPCRP